MRLALGLPFFVAFFKNRPVKKLSAEVLAASDFFTPTHWSVVLAAAESQIEPENARAALAQLCQTYWPPLYTYARAVGHSWHDAEDVTQGFFAYFIEHKIYARTDRRKGKFRSFLLASFKHFLSDIRDRAARLKRGGDQYFVPFEEARTAAAESLLQSQRAWCPNTLPEDRLYERSWAETLTTTVLARLAAAYKAERKEQIFGALRVFLTVGAVAPPSYQELAARLAIAESTLRSHVARLRARYREMLRVEVRRTVENEAAVDAELRELLRVLREG